MLYQLNSFEKRKVEAARSAREENRDFPQKVPFAFRGNHLFPSELAA
jgi:hypothetical protein